jgi:hypothetical protein
MQIQFPTNINGKLHCDAFVHITYAPTRKLERQVVDRTIVTITTADNSGPVKQWRIYDIGIVAMYYVADADAFASHGCTKMQLLQKLFPDLPFDEAINKQVAIYYYVNHELAANFRLPTT